MTDVTFNAETHQYFCGLQELTSVSKVLRSCAPLAPDFSAIAPEVLENARDRGVVLDSLLSAWINGTLTAIPPGTRKDVLPMFDAVCAWIDAQGFAEMSAQVILADDSVAGTCDFIFDGEIYDLKCVSKLSTTYQLQVAAYTQLSNYGDGGLIHINASMKVPKIVRIQQSDLDDWRTLWACWDMAQRRLAK